MSISLVLAKEKEQPQARALLHSITFERWKTAMRVLCLSDHPEGW